MIIYYWHDVFYYGEYGFYIPINEYIDYIIDNLVLVDEENKVWKSSFIPWTGKIYNIFIVVYDHLIPIYNLQIIKDNYIKNSLCQGKFLRRFIFNLIWPKIIMNYDEDLYLEIHLV